jgi:hypothetical protein
MTVADDYARLWRFAFTVVNQGDVRRDIRFNAKQKLQSPNPD